MFLVVEFSDKCGGGVGLVRREWLTPRKKECLWPPYKLSFQFNKALIENQVPDDTWILCGINRQFYETDDILKAREKLKAAENESDLQTDSELNLGIAKRKRKAVRKLYDDESDYDESPPKKQSISKSMDFLNSLPSEDIFRPLSQITGNIHTKTNLSVTSPTPGSRDTDTELLTQISLPSTSSPEVYLNRLSTSTPGLTSCGKNTSQITASVGNSTTKTCKELTSTPGLTSCGKNTSKITATVGNTTAKTSYEVIARHLANIDARLNTIYDNQLLILQTFGIVPINNIADCNATNSIPCELQKPCNTEEDVIKLEKWLETEQNVKSLESSLSLRGGKNVKVVVQRILSKLFSNELAAQYNWTGKFNKKPLKNLKIIEVIHQSVRRNPYTTKASDLEISTAIVNWFRFVKDRDGGRERRRPIRPIEGTQET